MIKFQGFISKKAQKYLFKKMFFGLLKVDIAIALFLGSLSILAIIYFQIYVFLFIVLLGVLFTFIILFQSRAEEIPKSISIEEDIVYIETIKALKEKSVLDIKKVVDNGDFYDIIFYFPNRVHNCVCQKDLLVEGTIAEFEKLFEDKIMRK